MGSDIGSSVFLLFLVASSILFHCFIEIVKAETIYPPLEHGLSWNFYSERCPDLEEHIREHLRKVLHDNGVKLSPTLLHLHFNDCYAQGGCDASVLLDAARSGNNEKLFKIIEDLQQVVHTNCGNVVSCADIMAIAARDAVYLAGGPEYMVPLGRRDAPATRNATTANVHPSSFTSVDSILNQFAEQDFDAVDAVALLGGHTFGRSHCASFSERLYPTLDPELDINLASELKRICRTPNSGNMAPLDITTPNTFDNKYYNNLMKHQGILTVDQELFSDKRTKAIVYAFAYDQQLFFESFVYAIVKMGQLNVLTGSDGVIRSNCFGGRRSNDLGISSI